MESRNNLVISSSQIFTNAIEIKSGSENSGQGSSTYSMAVSTIYSGVIASYQSPITIAGIGATGGGTVFIPQIFDPTGPQNFTNPVGGGFSGFTHVHVSFGH